LIWIFNNFRSICWSMLPPLFFICSTIFDFDNFRIRFYRECWNHRNRSSKAKI
jgi:hypothetical protein